MENAYFVDIVLIPLVGWGPILRNTEHVRK